MKPFPGDSNDPAASDDLAHLREAAVRVVRELVNRDHVAYFAGGCVRDRLLGIEPTDYDIATDATPEEVGTLFHRAQLRGKAFGIMLVRLMGHEIQVATFRAEGQYTDGRHPDSVTFTDAQHDAQRRDFTINGIFENPLKDEIIDYVNGREDLANKIIRAIGDPQARLHEDRLRMLRAVRFAARFGFAIEADTADAIRSGAGELRGVSRERIGQEIKRMFSDPNRAVAAWEIQYLGLDEPVLQEKGQLVAPTHVGRLLDQTPYPTALAAWLLDRHATQTADLVRIAGRWAESLVLSNDERDLLMDSIRTWQTLTGDWTRLGVARQKRLAVMPSFEQGLQLVQAGDRQLFVDVRRSVLELAKTGLSPQPLLDGDDLIALGMTPGPEFSRILDAVYDAQLEGAIHEKQGALVLARAIAATASR